MAEGLLTLELCSQDRVPVTCEAAQVVMPGEGGVFAVLSNHTPLLSTLIPGVVIAYLPGGETKFYAVSGGFVEVMDNRVLVLADTLEEGEKIDTERAREAQERAEKRLVSREEGIDVVRAELALGRSLARLQAHAREEY